MSAGEIGALIGGIIGLAGAVGSLYAAWNITKLNREIASDRQARGAVVPPLINPTWFYLGAVAELVVCPLIGYGIGAAFFG